MVYYVLYFLYMFLLVHQGCWKDDVQLMVDFWVLEWADSPRGIHGSPDAVCQLAATSEVVPFLAPCSAATESI